MLVAVVVGIITAAVQEPVVKAAEVLVVLVLELLARAVVAVVDVIPARVVLEVMESL